MLSRSSAAVYSCPRQLLYSTKLLCISQVRANSTTAAAASTGADTPKRRRTIPLAQDFGGLVIPDAHSKPSRLGRDAHRRLASLGNSPIASRLAGRESGEAGQTLQNQIRKPDYAEGQRRTPGQGGKRSERTGGKPADETRPNNEGASRWVKQNNTSPRRSQQKEEEPDFTVTPKPENFTINIGTDLDALFSSAPTIPASSDTLTKVVKAAPQKTKATPAQSPKAVSPIISSVRLQYALQRQAGDYSRIGPHPIRSIEGDSIRTLGARGLAEQIIRRKAEVGLKSKANALEVVAKLTSKALQTIQA